MISKNKLTLFEIFHVLRRKVDQKNFLFGKVLDFFLSQILN